MFAGVASYRKPDSYQKVKEKRFDYYLKIDSLLYLVRISHEH